MIDYEFGLICMNSIIDQKTAQLSIINIIDRISLETLPGVIQNVSIVTFWKRKGSIENPLTFKFRMVRNPEIPKDIADLEIPELEYTIPEKVKDARFVLQIGGLFIANAGNNKFIFEIRENNKWKSAGTINLDVMVGSSPLETTSSPATTT